MKIVMATTCKNRAGHIKQTLPQNLAGNPRSKFVILNYGTTDDLLEYLFTEHAAEIESGRLVVYSHFDEPVFRMGHAKNMAMRCGMLEGADILVTLDADNFAGPGFEDHIDDLFKDPSVSFARPNFAALPPIGQRYHPEDPLLLARGFYGRLAIRPQAFIKMGGYDEAYETWRGEDADMLARLYRVGLKGAFLDKQFLRAINHPAQVRFAEYPHAQQYENAYEQRLINSQTHRIVNFGKIGCGTVHRHPRGLLDMMHALVLKPLPTRIFGIGLQKTATTSLHEAFKILGFDSLHWGAGEARKIWQEMNESGTSTTLERFYALSDNPIPLFYKELDAAYPGSKFILTVRDPAAWIKSMERLWSYDHNPTRWMWDVWPISNRIHRALYGREDFDAATMLARYHRHNLDVIQYFARHPPAKDLLIMGMGEYASAGWPELCGFLGVPIPDVPYPYANGGNGAMAKPKGAQWPPPGYSATLPFPVWVPEEPKPEPVTAAVTRVERIWPDDRPVPHETAKEWDGFEREMAWVGGSSSREDGFLAATADPYANPHLESLQPAAYPASAVWRVRLVVFFGAFAVFAVLSAAIRAAMPWITRVLSAGF